jgi:ABC-type glycerol-3-phosphate transport system substrate-binding protein
MKNKSIFFAVSLLVIALALMASQPAITEASVINDPSTSTQSEGKDPVVLTFLKIADELEAQAFVDMVKEFQTIEDGKWSYVTVEYDTKPWAELFPAISRAIATGSDVDIIQADGPNVKSFAYNGILADLTDEYSAEELAQWAPSSVAEGSLDGRFYAPPEAESCQLMWYNADMLDAAGIDVTTTDGWTYGDDGTGLVNWQKLTTDENGDGNPEVYGFSTIGFYDYFYRIPARSNGVVGDATYQGVSDDGLTFTGYFDTEEAVEAYQFMQDMVYKYNIASPEVISNQMLSGLAATVFYQDMIIGTQKDQFPDFNMGAIEPPYFETPLCQTGSWHYGVAANTDNYEEAVAFVKFASSDAGAKYIWDYKNQMPANLALFNSIDEFSEDGNPRALMADFFQEYGAPRIETVAYTEYNTLFGQFFTDLMSGEEDVQALTTEYAELMDEAALKYAK